MVEHVLAIPTRVLRDAGLFQGLSRDVAHYLPRLLDPERLVFLPRPEAELDPEFKQIIPYVVLRYRDQIFHYRRGRGANEKRLHALRSVGVGGHINPVDQGAGDVYRAGMLRELREELFLESAYEERILGIINDDSLDVGKVHVGIVHVLDLTQPNVRRREDDLMHAGFGALAELRQAHAEFETWSQFVLAALDQACYNFR